MQAYNLLAFDEIISGASTNWYTSLQYASVLGTADALTLLARTSYISGTSPTLTIAVEHSPDGRYWSAAAATPEIDAVTVSGATRVGSRELFQPVLSGLIRCRISLGGTSPRCHLKLYITGRHAGAPG